MRGAGALEVAVRLSPAKIVATARLRLPGERRLYSSLREVPGHTQRLNDRTNREQKKRPHYLSRVALHGDPSIRTQSFGLLSRIVVSVSARGSFVKESTFMMPPPICRGRRVGGAAACGGACGGPADL